MGGLTFMCKNYLFSCCIQLLIFNDLNRQEKNYKSKHQLNSIQHVISYHCLLVWSKPADFFISALKFSIAVWFLWLCFFSLLFQIIQDERSSAISLVERFYWIVISMYVIVIADCVADFVRVLEKWLIKVCCT